MLGFVPAHETLQKLELGLEQIHDDKTVKGPEGTVMMKSRDLAAELEILFEQHRKTAEIGFKIRNDRIQNRRIQTGYGLDHFPFVGLDLELGTSLALIKQVKTVQL